jgi:hypothetical protein
LVTWRIARVCSGVGGFLRAFWKCSLASRGRPVAAGQVIAHRQRQILRPDRQPRARIVELLAAHHGLDVRYPARKHVAAVGQLDVKVGHAAQPVLGAPADAGGDQVGVGDLVGRPQVRDDGGIAGELGIGGEHVVEIDLLDRIDLMPGQRHHQVQRVVVGAGRGKD